MPSPPTKQQRLRQPEQGALPLEPAPELLRQEMERIRCSRSYWRQRFRTLDELLADPTRERLFLIYARHALRARLQRGRL